MLATRDIYYTYILQPRALSFPPSIKSIAAIVIHTHIIYNTHFETCYTRAKAQRYHCEAERIHTLFVPDDSLLFTSVSPSMRATYMYEPCKKRSRQSTVKQKKNTAPLVSLSLSLSLPREKLHTRRAIYTIVHTYVHGRPKHPAPRRQRCMEIKRRAARALFHGNERGGGREKIASETLL